MSRNSATAAKLHDVSTTLKQLDQEICASLPQAFAPHAASRLLEEHGQRIADTLETLAAGDIRTVVHAIFHDFSQSPAHREAARRWFALNRREAKKARYVFERFDGLCRLNHLKDALSQKKIADAQTAADAEQPAASVSLQLPPASVHLLFVEPNIHGEYPPSVVEQVHGARQDRNYIFLAFPPKCGGTYIREVVGRLSGAGPNPFRPGRALGGRDVVPYLPLLAAQMLSPTGPKAFMTHAHMVGHYSNIQLLNLFKIKPVVMKRSIPDMLCSYADMVQAEGWDRNGGYNWSLLCGVHTDASFLRLDANARTDFLIHHQAPWYIQFYASWLRADRNGWLPVHWTTYDVFRADPVRTITGILEFYGLAEKAAAIPDVIEQAEANKNNLRFNRGVSGRGAQLLKPHHLHHLNRLAQGYPDIDFVAEGLLPPIPSAATA